MDIVIARYQENISWIQNLNKDYNVIVYNKFFKEELNSIPNVGREGHTYLYHIINNYNSLSEMTVFCQGDPICHNPKFLDQCNNISLDFSDENTKFIPLCNEAREGPFGNIYTAHKLGLPMYYFFDLLFGIKLEINSILNVYYGAQFAAKRNIIQNRPLDFYRFLIKFLSFEKDPIEGYIVERLWPYILNPNYKLSEKYLKFL